MSGADTAHGGPVCRTDVRRGRVREAALNGVDTVEAGDDGLTLVVTFLGKAPEGLGPEHVRIDGGRRITGLRAVEVAVEREEDPELDDRLVVTLDRTGDTSRYRLSVVETDPYGRPGEAPFPGFDQRYFAAGFVFSAECPSPFDCGPVDECGCAPDDGCGSGGGCAADSGHGPDGGGAPVVDYTARDFDTLRTLLLERLALTAPGWVERNPADLGVTLVDLLAHTGDLISYQQDAVATEAYLDTARRRVSVRRHARLVDYPMHDGVNARAFVTVAVERAVTLAAGSFRFAAVDPVGAGGPFAREVSEPGTVVDDRELGALAERGPVEVFEPVAAEEPALWPAHNTISFWTWGEEVCALPRGATAATLRDAWADEACEERALRLTPGDLLLIEEVRGARSGTPGDADPAHRQAVRLTSVTPAVDALCGQPVLEVAWARADALRFPVVLAVRGGPRCEPVPDVSVARGNVVLVDHGRSLTFCCGGPETVPVPPEPAVPGSCDPCGPGCPGEDRGNAPGALLAARIAQTESGRLLTGPQLRELFAAVGEEAVVRSGLRLELVAPDVERVLPGTAYEQAERVRTLLAQSVYPGIAPRLRPVLARFPVVQAVPFPRPGDVAAGQAERLAGIPGRVRERLVELWRSARDGDGLAEEEIEELAVLFGLGLLERIGLRRHPVRALRELLHRSGRLLAAGTRRLEVLRARALAGTVLDASVAWEIERSWGARYAAGLDPDDPVLRGPAAAAVGQDPREALPAVTAVSADGGPRWTPRRDLLDSGPRDAHLVGELTDDGRLALRFGDGRYGARPAPGSRLELRYRIGGGTAGNVGAESITHLVVCRTDPQHVQRGECGPPPVSAVRNPLPAVGGTEPETLDAVRRAAPLEPRRTRLRAVTAADYAKLAGRVPGVRRAAAELRWTGSAREAHVAVDAAGTADPPARLLDAVAYALERYRRIGHEVVVAPARSVPLDVALSVCAAPGHQHGRILAELYRLLGAGRLPGGRIGFFHPDALEFGEPVRLSRLVAVAAAVRGVVDVRVTRLARLFEPEPRGGAALASGVLRIGPLEVARCDNDPDRPGNGRLSIELSGGAR
ncbi:putative baseplate assembly protein [Streptomyces yaizuensis]|uniref:Baseplate assembly protein n=1 Tax=Streptomyces yaizuensis TaxID=2989713 RepID=A0ABQ5NRW5_9ACTN|nr:putative baseplate assembly protein [Streptomyces sp. YSPA8]GLF93119.1 putative baseplate assembly protein [Streptomyces sp. YSPA8]